VGLLRSHWCQAHALCHHGGRFGPSGRRRDGTVQRPASSVKRPRLEASKRGLWHGALSVVGSRRGALQQPAGMHSKGPAVPAPTAAVRCQFCARLGSGPRPVVALLARPRLRGERRIIKQRLAR
jgi:hypothetical protein